MPFSILSNFYCQLLLTLDKLFIFLNLSIKVFVRFKWKTVCKQVVHLYLEVLLMLLLVALLLS